MALTKHPVIIDGIICYLPNSLDGFADYHSVGLDNLYAAENTHFWFITRREKICGAFKKYVPNHSRIMEIGAGTGYVAEGLQKIGYQVAVGEYHLSGLKYAKQKGIEECYQFDLFEPPFENEFDAIGMFDVIEHLEDDVFAMQQASRMIKPGGYLFVTVPAHQWLWSRNDKIAAHKRRYNKRMIINSVEIGGLEIVEMSYFFASILPLLFLRKLIYRDHDGVVIEKERQKKIPINLLLNKFLLILTRVENYFSQWLPNIAGGSLLLVAKKHRSP
ncbi:MAG: class I SAM-dependent methyltransferase [Proteobacteria bacterium]|nr:class I SAM-dependent methyltransferase [Pseudomonadota bacterium]MBU1648822.1 class I SAM-dependent methyltransferase [Pseudomonadota bacterium]